MRTTRRMIIILGCVGFMALYLLQYRLALAVTPLLLIVGALTGLTIAKWLPWHWYGRQFSAGVQAGAVTCGLSAAGVLLSLIGTGSHNVASLAARSHLSGIDLSAFVKSLGAAGWFMPYLLLTLFFALGGVLVAGALAQVVGWSKNVRTVRVIREAHDSAALLHRTQTWGPASNSVPSIGGYWNSVIPSSGPASQPGLLAAGAVASSGRASVSRAPASGGGAGRGRGGRELTVEPQPSYLAPLPSLDFDGFDGFDAPFSTLSEPMSVPMSEPIPPRPTHSGAHPVKHSISDELRSVLEAWDDGSETTPATDSADSPNAATSTDTAEPAEPRKAASTRGSSASKSKTPSKRQPKASAYLNSTPSTAPRRSRKKQNTRDWLC